MTKITRSETKEYFLALVAVVGLALLFVGCVWLKWSNYSECREHFSALYCLTADSK